MAQTVPGHVHLTVNLTHVETRTDGVLHVLQDGPVIIVQQVNVVYTLSYIMQYIKVLQTFNIKHFKETFF